MDRPGRAVTPPRAPRQLVKLFPIAFVPNRHFLLDPESARTNLSTNTFASTRLMHAWPIRFTTFLPRIPLPWSSTVTLRPIHILHLPADNLFSFTVVSNTLRDNLFRELGTGRWDWRWPHRGPNSECILRRIHQDRFMSRDTTHISGPRPARRAVYTLRPDTVHILPT